MTGAMKITLYTQPTHVCGGKKDTDTTYKQRNYNTLTRSLTLAYEQAVRC
ncbi:hypothetical protein HmCmsJML041_03613 [Escherichia coli]|nr:hypothetical protein HmCmsJML041_03613 [Escherichia coli]